MDGDWCDYHCGWLVFGCLMTAVLLVLFGWYGDVSMEGQSFAELV